MIVVKDLAVRFGKSTVVDGVSFALQPGESLALWGENGAGKTTVIRALLGLVPFSGEVTVAGHKLPEDGRMARAAVGYVPQQLAFYDDLSALGLLHFFANLRGAPRGEAESLLERVALAEHRRKPVGTLSGGMKQRLALAVALLGDPPLLMLDEPTASLDTRARGDFMALLTGLRHAGKSLLVTSHRVAEVAALADRALVLERGRAQLTCPAAELEAALYPQTTLRILLDPALIDLALATLLRDGYKARANGRGVHVQVEPGHRGAPVAALIRAEIQVIDLLVEDGPWTASE